MLTDHLGSVVAVLDGSGAVVGEQRYRPFGQPRLTPGITQTDRGFTGQQNLADAGLQDFHARWLNTSLGVFASPDSLVSDPFDPQGLSRYGYVFSNPLRYTDPSGHRPCEYDVDSCRPAPSPAALRGTTVHGGQTLAGGGMGSRVVTDAYTILNEDRRTSSGAEGADSGWSEVNALMDEMFNPMRLPLDEPYEGTVYEQADVVVRDVYPHYGYDLTALAARGVDNPVDQPMIRDYLENRGLRYLDVMGNLGPEFGVFAWVELSILESQGADSHRMVLREIGGMDLDHPTNYERNYLDALYSTHPVEVALARGLLIDTLIHGHGPNAAAVYDALLELDLVGVE